MKTYSVPFGRKADYKHPAPERTAYRVSNSLGGDDYYQVWPSRAAMLKTIEMQGKRASKSTDWRPLVKEAVVSDTEYLAKLQAELEAERAELAVR